MVGVTRCWQKVACLGGSVRCCSDKKRYVLLECGRGGNLVVGDR